jgi:hypothetical protein
MVAPDKRNRQTATGHATATTDTEDDIIRQELARRAEFDK